MHTIQQYNYTIFAGETQRISESGYTHVFKYQDKNPVGPVGTSVETVQHMKKALAHNSTIRYSNRWHFIWN